MFDDESVSLGKVITVSSGLAQCSVNVEATRPYTARLRVSGLSYLVRRGRMHRCETA
jgi:hypothetical protein